MAHSIVYVITSDYYISKNLYKIGYTTNNVADRISPLNTSCLTDELKFCHRVKEYQVPDGSKYERKLHSEFRFQRRLREFYELSSGDLEMMDKIMKQWAMQYTSIETKKDTESGLDELSSKVNEMSIELQACYKCGCKGGCSKVESHATSMAGTVYILTSNYYKLKNLYMISYTTKKLAYKISEFNTSFGSAELELYCVHEWQVSDYNQQKTFDSAIENKRVQRVVIKNQRVTEGKNFFELDSEDFEKLKEIMGCDNCGCKGGCSTVEQGTPKTEAESQATPSVTAEVL